MSARGPLEAQVIEAIALIEGGSDYDRRHVVSVLENGLRAGTVERASYDLLAALEGIVEEWGAGRFEWSENRPEVLGLRVKQPRTGGDFFDVARAAIAKAKGA